ncbi:MAG: sugar-binding protein [Armatimonadota bacterium]
MKQMIMTFMMIVLLLGSVCLAQSEPAPELVVASVAMAPRIDGRLDEACWQGPAPITDFRCVDKARSMPTQRTQAWVACDAEALYVAARCTDDRMDQVPATVTELDGPVWQDDCLEVFLMPGTPYYYHFAANLLGAKYDARQRVGARPDDGKPADWNGDWQVAARRETDCWTMEIAIPFACLEWGAARLTAPPRFNIGREQRRLAEFSCWPASGFNKTEQFAVLGNVSVDTQRYGLLLEGVVAGQMAPGTNRYTATIAEEPTPGTPLTLRAHVKALPQGPEQTYTTQVKSSVGTSLALDYQIPLAGGRTRVMFECLGSDGKARLSQSQVWRVPAPLEASLDLPLVYRSDGEVRMSGRVALHGAVKLQAALVANGKRLSAVPVPVDRDGLFRVQLPLRDLQPGCYAIETQLSAPGTSSAPVVNQFAFRVIAGPLD